MSTFKLNIESSSIEDLKEVTFDAEFGASIRGETKITGYPVEEGFEIANGIINQPEFVRVKLGMGVKKLSGLLTDPLETLQNNWTSYITSVLSSYLPGGVISILATRYAQTLAAALLSPSSRQGQVFVTLQALRLTGADVNLVIHNIGILNNFNIKQVELGRSDRDDITIDVTFQQRIGKGRNNRTITTAQGTTDLGSISTREQIESL